MYLARCPLVYEDNRDVFLTALPSGGRPTYQNLGKVSLSKSSSRSCYIWPKLRLLFFIPRDAWPNFKPPAAVTHGSAPKRSGS